MRKQLAKRTKTPFTLKPVKALPSLDDTTIRALLRGSYRELEEEAAEESMAENNKVWVLQSMTVPSEPNWVDPDFLKSKADLFIFWSLYAQKQVVLFDQESTVLGHWDNRDPW